MSTPFDRRNQQVWGALDAPGGGAKQALQIINRRLKKGEKSDYLLVMKAFVLAQMASPGSIGAQSPVSEALSICNEIGFKNSPPKESETVKLLELTYINLGRKEEVGKLHEHLYKLRLATPGRTTTVDELGLKEWYNGCMRACDWVGLQKAAMTLQKQFPKNRQYYFWAITACYILVVACDDDKRQSVAIFGTLASRMISKAASEIPEDDKPGPIRSIKNSAELQLFYDILSFTKTSDAEVTKYLESPTTGYNSKLGSDYKWELWWHLVAAKNRIEHFEEVNTLCLNVLSTGTIEGQNGAIKADESQSIEFNGESKNPLPSYSSVWADDWKVWTTLASSAAQLGIKDPNSKIFSKTAEFFKQHVNGEKPTRNGLLANVHLSSIVSQGPNTPAVDGITGLSDACFEFFKKQGKTSSCYDDLRPYIIKLTDEEKQDILGRMGSFCKELDITSTEIQRKELSISVRTKITWLKFYFLIEVDTESEKLLASKVDEFLEECANVYQATFKTDTELLVTDMRDGDELLLLMAKTLIGQYEKDKKELLPIKIAIILLDHLLISSKHNYTALLLIVRLYSIIGAFSCATIEYQRLNIKQVQNDTLSYHILTRLSTLLPFASSTVPKPSSSTDVYDLGVHVPANPTDSLEMYDISLKLYKNAHNQNPNLISQAFKSGAYGQIKDMVLFEKRVSNSVAACHFEIERRRVQRFRGIAESFSPLWDRALHIQTSDNRQFDLFSEDGWHNGSDMGPRVSDRWIQGFLLAENIIGSISAYTQSSNMEVPKTSSTSQSSNNQANTESPLEKLRGLLNGETSNVFTKAEREALDVVVLIGDVHSEAEQLSKSSVKVKTLLGVLDSRIRKVTESLLSTTVGSGNDPLDSQLQGQLSTLSISGNGKNLAPWEEIHQIYMLIELLKYTLTLLDYLEKSTQAKSLKPQLPKTSLSQLRSTITTSHKSILQLSKEQSKKYIQVSESDIDDILQCRGLELPILSEFLRNQVGRERVETYLDKFARSQSSSWNGIASVKVG